MKTIACLCACAWALAGAGADLALARERLLVVDSDGRPVENAKIAGGFNVGTGMGSVRAVDGLTDARGVFVAGGYVLNQFHYRVTKDGYYATEGDLRYGAAFPGGARQEKGRWQPFGSERRIVLKRCMNPSVPGVRFADRPIPAFDRWLGFDLERADFTGAYGGGARDDVLLRFSERRAGPLDFGCAMDVCFTNQPFAGAYVRSKDSFSEFTADYAADTNANYRAFFRYEVDRGPEGLRTWNVLDAENYLVFRTRTRVDGEGRLVSAHYGRIDGPCKFHEGRALRPAGVFFNPRVNDPWLEECGGVRDGRATGRVGR